VQYFYYTYDVLVYVEEVLVMVVYVDVLVYVEEV